MAGKRVNRISVFLSDEELQQLVLDADESHREPADYLRSLYLLDRERRAQDLAQRLSALYAEREDNQRQQGGSSVQRLPTRAPVERDEQGWPTTVADGG
jgi:hypothetical protein